MNDRRLDDFLCVATLVAFTVSLIMLGYMLFKCKAELNMHQPDPPRVAQAPAG